MASNFEWRHSQPPKSEAKGKQRKEEMELIDKILSAKNLTEACHDVVRNQGASGVDAMSVKELKAYLDINRASLSEEIRTGNYHPHAIRGKEILKSNGKVRLLGIPTVIDRMLQQAVSRTIMTRFEYIFSDYSYGFRPKRNQLQAILKSYDYINAGFQDIVDIDLQGFFDEVSHVLLLEILYRKIKCKATMRLIRRWLRVPVLLNGKLAKRRKGIPQGSPLSPLLSNIMLHELDMELEKRRLKFVRYADDFSIYFSNKSEARRVGNEIYLYLKHKLKLPINRAKSGIRRPSNFSILGHRFTPTFVKGEKGKYQLIVDESRWKLLKFKLKEITRKTSPLSFDQRIEKLKDVQRGWLNYYKLSHIYAKLAKIDSWLRNRLRACIWHDWKKSERKRKNLIRLGVSQGKAYAHSRTRKGTWAVAQSPILTTTITLKRLARRGYESLETHYLKVCPHYRGNTLFPYS